MKLVKAPILEAGTASFLHSLGTPNVVAQCVARVLVLADQSGHFSHGVARLPEYVAKVSDGSIRPTAKCEIWKDGAFGRINGNWGWGQFTASQAVELASDIVQETGVAIVSTENCNHVGRLGGYGEELGSRGLMAVLLVNGEPNAAPYGCVERLVGTNPIALAVPMSNTSVVHDIATTESAEGKLRLLLQRDEVSASQCVITSDGKLSNEPRDYYEGGALIPFAGHKGSGLMVLIDLMAGSLSGHSALVPEFERGNGLLIIAFDPHRFPHYSPDELVCAVNRLRESKSANGRPVYAPGDIEKICRDKSRQAPVEITDEVYSLLYEYFDMHDGENSNNIINLSKGDKTLRDSF